MSVRLRLTRMGRKKRPFYRIVAADSRAPRDGKFLESIGTYNPLTKPATVEINREAAMKWLQNGALPSDTVRSLFSKHGIMFELDLIKRGLTPAQIELEYKKQEAVKAEQLKKQEALEAQKRRDAEKKGQSSAKAKAEKAELEAPSVAAPQEATSAEEQPSEA